MPKPEHLQSTPFLTLEHSEEQNLRLLSRSPQPYHHQNFELLHPTDRIACSSSSSSRKSTSDGSEGLGTLRSPRLCFSKESSQGSDSGTEADDESFLKSLPAPKARWHKGLRGQNEALSGTTTPLLSTAIPEHDATELGEKLAATSSVDWRLNAERVRRRRNIIRRCVEVGILAGLGLMVTTKREVCPLLKLWSREISASVCLLVTLVALYPVRVTLWTYLHREPTRWVPLKVPIDFDPAPVLYPHATTMLTTLLLAVNNPDLVLPNLILSISSIPEELIPATFTAEKFNALHWLLSLIPLTWASSHEGFVENAAQGSILDSKSVAPGVAVLLYPLHETLRGVLNYLTTTSLLPAELQLFSISLINILLLSVSPQIRVLKALLWGGGLGVLVSCGPVIAWGIALARVPKWRFRRAEPRTSYQSLSKYLFRFFSRKRLKHGLEGARFPRGYTTDGGVSSDDSLDSTIPPKLRVTTFAVAGDAEMEAGTGPATPMDHTKKPDHENGFSVLRRHTFPAPMHSPKLSATHTPGGRRKRSTSTTVRAFFRLTQEQANARKWLYAAWVYACLLGIILVGIRGYITRYALHGNEAIGWTLGYLLGDLNWFRFKVVRENLDRWVCLPPRYTLKDEVGSCQLGWVQHIRQVDFGEANMRLLISAYWIMILIVGLVVVYRLKDIYEVDTRRKVFHFMMVAMFLPATYIDPAFAALALAIVLAIFLILDLLRASQLPPLSKPITYFLAPYVDGRDFQGPVVISHIFLLIGCAIPLWLTLGSLPRTGTGYLAGWEIPTREVSMVSGVVCVGLGDAAASLIGRRWGHRKWLWGGGKSLEGSLAFATAVFIGLLAASFWLRLGGWPVTESQVTWWPASLRNAGVCASIASLTEAVLTGGNDNVIVPVVLWTCVKSLGV